MGTGLAAKKKAPGTADKAAAFAQKAERYRRKGDPERAVELCKEGLLQFPEHLSGRVTLGWALLDLGRLDEARGELEQVLKRAPDNLTAIRGLAELHERADNTMALDMSSPHPWQDIPTVVADPLVATVEPEAAMAHVAAAAVDVAKVDREADDLRDALASLEHDDTSPGIEVLGTFDHPEPTFEVALSISDDEDAAAVGRDLNLDLDGDGVTADDLGIVADGQVAGPDEPAMLSDTGVDRAEPGPSADAADGLDLLDLTDALSDDLLTAVAAFESAEEAASEERLETASALELELDAGQDADLEAALAAADDVEDVDASSGMASAATEAREAAAMAEATELALAQIEAARQAEDFEADLVALEDSEELPDTPSDAADVTPVVASAEPDFLATDATPLADHDSPLITGRETSEHADATEAMAAAASALAHDEQGASDDDRAGFASPFGLDAASQAAEDGGAEDSFDRFGSVDDSDEPEGFDDLEDSRDAVAAALAAAQAGGGNQGFADQLAAYTAIQRPEPASVDHTETSGSELAALITGSHADEWVPPAGVEEIPPSLEPAEAFVAHPPPQQDASSAIGRLEQMLRRIQTRRLRLAAESVA